MLNHRSSFNTLAEALIAKGDTAKAREALIYSITRMPDIAIPYDYSNAQTVGAASRSEGEKEKALAMANIMWPRADALSAYLSAKANSVASYRSTS